MSPKPCPHLVARAECPWCLESLVVLTRTEAAQIEAALAKAKAAIEALGPEGECVIEHTDEDCPEDDSCACPIIAQVNGAHAASVDAIALLDGKVKP